jgi:RNA polymerase sigma factor (sigma-70 family)
MTATTLNPFIRYIRKLAGPNQVGDPADRELLERFCRERDESAFATLLDRHGPLVLSVCRRMLRDANDVDDAFQASFLVLVRKARSIRRPEQLSNWLYGVAYRAAAKARADSFRARAKELLDMPMVEQPSDQEWQQLGPILDDELNRLPNKLRTPIVLCYLQGRTYAEAARHLGWPPGTVSGRLARARDLLRTRLVRRGLGLSSAALSSYLTQNTASATSVLASLAAATTNSALLVGTGSVLTAGLVSPRIHGLIQGVMKAMFLTKLKTTAGILMALALIGLGGTVYGYKAWAKETEEEKEKPAPAKLKQNPKSHIAKNEGLAAPAPVSKDSPAAKPLSNIRMDEMKNTLSRVIKFEGINDPKATLGEFLESLSDRYDLTFEIKEASFLADNNDKPIDAISTEIAAKPLPKMAKVSLSRLLNKVLSRVPTTSGATYIIRGDVVEITTKAALRKEFGLTADQPLLPLVAAGFEKCPLEDALKELSSDSGFSIVLDSNSLDKTKSTVTAEFLSVPIDTAVRLLADTAKMKAVLVDNVLYVTSKESADQMQAEQEKRKKEALLAEKEQKAEAKSKDDKPPEQKTEAKSKDDKPPQEKKPSKEEKPK